jgi:deazaflavin-dependent oxidoreductase (nitroreductase family)
VLTRSDLANIRTIDLTTYGRRSGSPRTVEIWWFHVDGRFIITGTPGRRDWLANVRSRPEVVIGVSGVEIAAAVREVDDHELRRRVFTDRETRWYSSQAELDRLVETAPMIEVLLDLPD